MVRLSALRSGRLYPPGNIPGTHFCGRLSQPQGHIVTGRIMSTKNSDTIGNWTRDLLVCSAVPQPTAPPHAPCVITKWIQIFKNEWHNNVLPKPPIWKREDLRGPNCDWVISTAPRFLSLCRGVRMCCFLRRFPIGLWLTLLISSPNSVSSRL